MAILSKTLKNQSSPSVDIDINETGVTISAGQSFTIDPINYLYWSTPEVIAEITPFINSGDIVVNDGTNDLSAADGLRYLEYSDRATIQEDDVDVTRINTILNFEGAASVTNNGGGKATVTIQGTSEDSDDRFVGATCDANGCIVEARLLVSHDLCFLKGDNC
jgi:hypothetical protein